MENNDLKFMWQEAHKQDTIHTIDAATIEQTITMKHSKSISEILYDVKKSLLGYSAMLLIYICLMLYAFVYLGLHLSMASLIPLTLAGLFILIKTSSEIVRLVVITKSAVNMSIKESLVYFRKKLNNIRIIDFLSYLVCFYSLAFFAVYEYLQDIGGIANLSWDNKIIPLPFLGFCILILIVTPWFIMYQHNYRYKKIYRELDNSARILNQEK